MGANKSLDLLGLYAAMIQDAYEHLGSVSPRNVKLTLRKVSQRLEQEGLSFLTKTLPRLGKALDKALAGAEPLNATTLRLAAQYDSKLPKLFGELFNKVLSNDGTLLSLPDVKAVEALRKLLFVFYKYDLPAPKKDEQKVISSFVKTEEDLKLSDLALLQLQATTATTRNDPYTLTSPQRCGDFGLWDLTRCAQTLLIELFAHFDPLDITPRHGPGSVSTRERLWAKYAWRDVPDVLTRMYPFDAYFCASTGHVCDTYASFPLREEAVHGARVILVPKDSRGPRLISCEPTYNMWIQQGLGRAIVHHVERHPLTRDEVHFTDSTPNRNAALEGSKIGSNLSTLDLKDASDRVSLELVRLLFPERLLPYLESCRSTFTTLPDKQVVQLRKFAPMGSSLCFPVLALTVWALLKARAELDGAGSTLHVYGDDVIVSTTSVEAAITTLEAFGLRVNRDKSCTSGLFRESCGMDAFNGVCVTPVRIRTRWSESRSARHFESWISYENSLFRSGYYRAAAYVAACVRHQYGEVPSRFDIPIQDVPLLETVSERPCAVRRRFNKSLQRLEYRLLTTRARVVTHEMDGWSMLLRFFSESSPAIPSLREGVSASCRVPLSARTYTPRDSAVLSFSWRSH